ncbi:endonuclease/exonuclease/phosphatase family protein [Loktanella sp. Alg231-35]|uniref:endonuclease/exonuclease/phosphatase family protein n=1 Tax=Loktanella sp. Alg231-35 TaxID=1922220 RepID=UPI000D5508FA|nr:endonuclease/exonuclease/phosphatase family protein [Loktanella sp. Alg231-35]
MLHRHFIPFVTTVLLAQPSHSDPLVLGAWNIQDLHHQKGVHLRDFDGFLSVKRRTEDFELLEKYRDLFGRGGQPADVIALQEIGTRAALERLFAPSEYITIMSPRWENDDAAPGDGDVYTAITVRRDSGVSVIGGAAHASALEVLHTDGRPTRAGTGAILEFEGQQFAFLSVHLKSSCNGTRNIHRSPPGDCGTLWLQTPALRAWIEDMQSRGLPVIIAGDFNRRFREMNFEGSLWETINGIDPTVENGVADPNFVALPQTTPRLCSTRKGSSSQPIDWFLVEQPLARTFVQGSYWERRWTEDDRSAAQGGRGLSDHCPISITLEFE